jgi:hypothetical protein
VSGKLGWLGVRREGGGKARVKCKVSDVWQGVELDTRVAEVVEPTSLKMKEQIALQLKPIIRCISAVDIKKYIFSPVSTLCFLFQIRSTESLL